MIDIRIAEASGQGNRERIEDDIFSEKFLIKRPLAGARGRRNRRAACPADRRIDQMSRSRHSCSRCSPISKSPPEIGTVKAKKPPIVITSNRTRKFTTPSNAAVSTSGSITQMQRGNRNSGEGTGCTRKTDPASGRIRQHLRNRDLFKLPGVAETIDWTNALIQLDKIDLDPETVNSSLGVLLKYQDDIERVQGSEAAQILDEVKAGINAGTDHNGRNPDRYRPHTGSCWTGWMTTSSHRISCISGGCFAPPVFRSSGHLSMTNAVMAVGIGADLIFTGRCTRCSKIDTTSMSCSIKHSTSSGKTRNFWNG